MEHHDDAYQLLLEAGLANYCVAIERGGGIIKGQRTTVTVTREPLYMLDGTRKIGSIDLLRILEPIEDRPNICRIQ